MAYAIRPFRPADAEALAALTVAAIRSVGSQRYGQAQVDAWAARHSDPQRFLDRDAAGHLIYVAADAQDEPAAYALLEPADECGGGHLDMLYCHPDHTRKGLADELLAHAEQQARAGGISYLFTEASELARSPFERAGYEVTSRRDFTIKGVGEHAGKDVPIHNYAMRKDLG